MLSRETTLMTPVIAPSTSCLPTVELDNKNKAAPKTQILQIQRFFRMQESNMKEIQWFRVSGFAYLS